MISLEITFFLHNFKSLKPRFYTRIKFYAISVHAKLQVLKSENVQQVGVYNNSI